MKEEEKMGCCLPCSEGENEAVTGDFIYRKILRQTVEKDKLWERMKEGRKEGKV